MFPPLNKKYGHSSLSSIRGAQKVRRRRPCRGGDRFRPPACAAISSRRSPIVSGSTIVAVRAPLAAFDTLRKWAAARAATGGL